MRQPFYPKLHVNLFPNMFSSRAKQLLKFSLPRPKPLRLPFKSAPNIVPHEAGIHWFTERGKLWRVVAQKSPPLPPPPITVPRWYHNSGSMTAEAAHAHSQNAHPLPTRNSRIPRHNLISSPLIARTRNKCIYCIT